MDPQGTEDKGDQSIPDDSFPPSGQNDNRSFQLLVRGDMNKIQQKTGSQSGLGDHTTADVKSADLSMPPRAQHLSETVSELSNRVDRLADRLDLVIKRLDVQQESVPQSQRTSSVDPHEQPFYRRPGYNPYAGPEQAMRGDPKIETPNPLLDVPVVPQFGGKQRLRQKEPDSFDGSDPSQLDSFIFKMELILQGQGDSLPPSGYPDVDPRVIYAMGFLTGSAGEWVRTAFLAVPRLRIFDSWLSFSRHLRFQYDDPARARTKFNELHALKQNGMPIQLFNTKFRLLVTECGMFEMEANRFYQHALDPRLMRRLIDGQWDIGTLQKAESAALWLDSNDRAANTNPFRSGYSSSTSRQWSSTAPTAPVAETAAPAKPAAKSTPVAKTATASTKPAVASNRPVRDNRSCYNCGETGHIRPNCPQPSRINTLSREEVHAIAAEDWSMYQQEVAGQLALHGDGDDDLGNLLEMDEEDFPTSQGNGTGTA